MYIIFFLNYRSQLTFSSVSDLSQKEAHPFSNVYSREEDFISPLWELMKSGSLPASCHVGQECGEEVTVSSDSLSGHWLPDLKWVVP